MDFTITLCKWSQLMYLNFILQLKVRSYWIIFLLFRIIRPLNIITWNNSHLFKGDKVEASDFKTVLGNMGLKLTEKEQFLLSKTLPISREYLTSHHGAQGNVILWALGGESSSAPRNPLSKMQMRCKQLCYCHLCFHLEVRDFYLFYSSGG